VTQLSRSERLRRRLDLIAPLALAPSSMLLEHPDCAALYPAYRVTCYSISKAYDALIATVLQHARSLAPKDPVAAGVADYLTEYIIEESGEDHLADLEVIGFDRSEIAERPTSPRVAALVGSLYFWSLQVHPVALLGGIQVAEGYPPTVDVIEQLIVRTGHPRRAFSSLFEHAERDVAHRAHLRQVIDDLPLSGEQESLISLSAFQAVSLLGEALNEILERHERGQRRPRETNIADRQLRGPVPTERASER
jgi:hypothetical protein